jgi:hypothetical protein
MNHVSRHTGVRDTDAQKLSLLLTQQFAQRCKQSGYSYEEQTAELMAEAFQQSDPPSKESHRSS